MNLALSSEELGIYFLQNQNLNSMLLNDIQIPTKAIFSDQNLKPPYATYSCIEFYQVLLTLVEKVILPPRSRSRTPTYISYSYTGNMLKHASIHPKLCSYTGSRQKMFVRKNTPCFKKIVISLNMWFKRHGLCKSMKK